MADECVFQLTDYRGTRIAFTARPGSPCWLLVTGRVETPDRSWVFEDECWEVSDLGRLANFFDTKRACQPCEELCFLERCTRFRMDGRDGDRICVVVTFTLECRPPGEPFEAEIPVPVRVPIVDFEKIHEALIRAAKHM